jgi:hypothetical protein
MRWLRGKSSIKCVDRYYISHLFNHEKHLIRVQIEFEASNPTGYWAILTNKSYRKGAFLSCFVQLAANSTGALVINYYSVIIYGNLGLTGYLPLLMYCIYTLIGALGNLFSLLTVDKTGRRFVRFMNWRDYEYY